MDKQDLFDFLKEHKKQTDPRHLVIILDQYRGIALMRYPPRPMEHILHPEEGKVLLRFEYVLLWRDFPRRNKIPIYKKNKICGWEDGKDPIPSPSLQRFLDSGEETYIPKHATWVGEAPVIDVKTLPIRSRLKFKFK